MTVAVHAAQVRLGLPALTWWRRAARRVLRSRRGPHAEHRQQGYCGDNGDDGDEQAAVAEAAQERDGQEHQGQEPDADGGTAEGHRPPGGGHGDHDRVVFGAAAVSFLSPAGDDEEGVVDGDAEADEGNQVLDKLADVGNGGDGPEGEEGGEDRYGGDDERDDGEERSEDQGQHDKGADGSNGELSQHADAAAARCVVQIAETRGGDSDSRRRGLLHSGGHLGRGRRVGGAEHQADRRSPVRADQPAIMDRRVGHHPQRAVGVEAGED